MRFEQVVVALDGTAQQLTFSPSGRTPLRTISFTAGPANAAPIYIGNQNVTDSVWANYIPASADSVPTAPFIPGDFDNGSMYLEDYWVRGTAGQFLHLGLWIYI